MRSYRLPGMRSVLRAAVGLLGVAAVCLGAGCGGSTDVSTAIRRPAAQRPDIDAARTAAGSLAVPTGQPFNIVSFKSGQDGAARGESKAAGENGASCRAEASAGGSAWAEFQLGYCFDNVTGAPLKAAVRLRLAAAESHARRPMADPAAGRPDAGQSDVKTSPPSTQPRPADAGVVRGTSTVATVLKFFIKDSNGLVVRQEDLVSTDLEKGSRSVAGEHDLVFDVQFEPQRGYYLVVAGRTELTAGGSEAVESSLGVTRCSFDIAWQGAAASGAAKDGSGIAGGEAESRGQARE